MAPWLSWLKRLSSKQEIPSSNLGGALETFCYFFEQCIQYLSKWHSFFLKYKIKRQCRDPGSNRGPLDLQSNALPTELSRLVCQLLISKQQAKIHEYKSRTNYWKKTSGPAEIWTRIAGFRVQSANHYTTGPFVLLVSEFNCIKQQVTNFRQWFTFFSFLNFWYNHKSCR